MLEKLQFIHFISFIGFFGLFGILEYLFPLRKNLESKSKRWVYNIGLSFINTIFARFLLFITPISTGLYLEKKGIGLFNLFEINFILELIISVIILDFIIYVQHILSHKIKWIWKIHRIHHSDKNLDVSTAIRFHILEIIFSLFIKVFFIILLGLNPIIIVIFEIILVSGSIFSHSNLKLPNYLDKYLSLIIVTPEFHQVHHSIFQEETGSNYGFFLSIWDKIFNTYSYHKFLVKEIGLKENKKDLNFKDLLLLDIDKK